MSIIIAIIVFSIIVIVHELGHFWAARKMGVLVEEFAVGMGPTIFKIRKGDTVYSLRLFPIGGFCRMLGEDEDCKDDRAFNNKPVGRRMIIIMAGVVMNFLLAAVIILVLNMLTGYTTNKVYGILPNTPAEQSGLLEGDRIVQMNDTKTNLYIDISYKIYEAKNITPIEITVLRDGKRKVLDPVTPYEAQDDDGNTVYKLGFQPEYRAGLFEKLHPDLGVTKRAGILGALSNGFLSLIFYTKIILVGVFRLFTFQANLNEMSGAIGIVEVIGTTYTKSIAVGFLNMLSSLAFFVSLLSMNLAVFNLLPLPALDGGRMVFLILEAIRKKPVPAEKEGLVHLVGFALLIGLAVFIAYNDIVKIIAGH